MVMLFFAKTFVFTFGYVLCAILTDCLLGGGRLIVFDWFVVDRLFGFDWIGSIFRIGSIACLEVAGYLVSIILNQSKLAYYGFVLTIYLQKHSGY